MTYTEWMQEVDQLTQHIAGCSIHDLTDQPFRDWFDDEMDPDEAARTALEDNGW